jgi:dephospho-CoA kinase
MLDIAFCGYIASGKTYIATKLKEKHGGRVESIANPLKNFAQDLLNTLADGLLPSYKKVRKPEHRNFLVFIGEKLRDPQFGHDNFWIEKINFKKENNEPVFIDDVRHPNEAKLMKSKGFIIVRLDVSEEIQQKRAIERDGAFDPSIRNHHSEISHLKIKPDIIIDANNKTPEEIIAIIERELTIFLKFKIKLRKVIHNILTRN